MLNELKKYIEENYEEVVYEETYAMESKPRNSKKLFSSFLGVDKCYSKCEPYDEESSSIDDYIEKNNNENKFQTLLFKYIDDRNLKDSDVYNKVHIDRRLFSKIRGDNNYHPSKETIILLAISLELNEQELLELLDSASYSLPKNNYFDLIIRFCFLNKIYNISDINYFLEQYNCKLFNY